MAQHQHPAHPGDCIFLGTKGRFDLYFDRLPVPTVIARWGGGSNFYQWPLDNGPRSSVQFEAFDHALSLARKMGYLD